MPIKSWDAYPTNWQEISFAIRDGNDWQCQECNVQCRRPQQLRDHTLPELTVAHYDHRYDDAEVFLAALCAPCHLRHDAVDAWRRRRRNLIRLQERAGQRQFALQWRLV